MTRGLTMSWYWVLTSFCKRILHKMQDLRAMQGNWPFQVIWARKVVSKLIFIISYCDWVSHKNSLHGWCVKPLNDPWLALTACCSFSGQQSYVTTTWTNLWRDEVGWGVEKGSPQYCCCSSAQGLQLTSHSCWGLMTKHCKSQQQGHFLNSAVLVLIGSGTASLVVCLIAS